MTRARAKQLSMVIIERSQSIEKCRVYLSLRRWGADVNEREHDMLDSWSSEPIANGYWEVDGEPVSTRVAIDSPQAVWKPTRRYAHEEDNNRNFTIRNRSTPTAD